MRKIWGAHKTVQVNFSKVIDRLVNFSDALSVAIREALSGQGLRVTSLVNLVEIESMAETQDEEMVKSGRRFKKTAGKIILRPTPGSKLGADEFTPLRPEYEGRPVHKRDSKYNAGITLTMTIEGLK